MTKRRQAKQDDGYHKPNQKIRAWCKAADISRQTFYGLEPECKPKVVKVGSRAHVIESPAEWYERMAALGGARTVEAVRERARPFAEKTQRERAARKAAKAQGLEYTPPPAAAPKPRGRPRKAVQPSAAPVVPGKPRSPRRKERKALQPTAPA